MPRYCHADSAYGCNHHDEHVAAAKLGWARRRAGDKHYQRFRAAEADLSAAYGTDVTKLHTHKSHRGEVRFKMDGHWMNLSTKEFREMEKWARKANRERVFEEKRIAKSEASAARKAAQNARAEEKYRRAMESYAMQETRQLEAQIRKQLRKDGIRPSKHTIYRRHLGRTVPVDYGEWMQLPSYMRRKRGKYDLDHIAEVLNEFGAISDQQKEDFTADDAVQYLLQMQERSTRGRMGRARKAVARGA